MVERPVLARWSRCIPGESEDIGKDWADPAALTQFGDRDPRSPGHGRGPLAP